MSKTPFMPLWVSDFIGDTLDLDTKEVGAYMLLLMTMWQRDGTLPSDQKKLQRVARVGRDWPRVWSAIGRYFNDENGVITNNRLTLELQKVATKREVNARAGARGGLAKALKTKDVGVANAIVSLKQPEPYLEPEQERKKRDTKVSPKKEDDFDFESFWDCVPKKVGKGAAKSAFSKALKKTTPEIIMTAMIGYASQREGQDHQFTVHPATWLNQERWLDEDVPTQADFHDRVKQMIGDTDGIRTEGEIDNGGTERISSQVYPATGDSDGSTTDRDQGHSGGSERAHLSLIKPRRFS